MSHTTVDSRSGGSLPWLVSGFGILSVAFFVGWCLWFASRLDATAVVVSFGTVAVPALGLVWGGYWLERSGIDPVRYGRVVQWCLGGGVGFLALNSFVMVFFPWYSVAGNLAWAHFSVNTGAIAGFAIGYVEARAIQREVEATSAAIRAQQLEDERELLSYLNDLLRHEVLNSAQIIGGHASLLLEDAEGRQRDHLETIDEESDALTGVIDDVRAILDANRGVGTATTVDLGHVLRSELADIRYQFESIEIEATIPDSLPVDGNEGVSWIFSNVLENAVEHNESDQPRIEVTVETTPTEVAVAVADNGPGIPDETRERLFERKSDHHGLGLYLSRILAKRYGGTIELTETGPDGSVFTVTLSRATAAGMDGNAGRDTDTDVGDRMAQTTADGTAERSVSDTASDATASDARSTSASGGPETDTT